MQIRFKIKIDSGGIGIIKVFQPTISATINKRSVNFVQQLHSLINIHC